MNYELRTMNSNRHRRGMAMLTVLFIVFAVAVISMGYLCRSDSALACGQNLCLRNQSDGLAWAGLEHARAVIQSYGLTPLKEPNSISFSQLPYALESNRIYTYEVTSEAWCGSDQKARSFLRADIRYWADDANGRAEFISIRRQ
jgi:hypothetical protein